MSGRRICKVIGTGTYGRVYEAIDLKTGQKQVVKVLTKSRQAKKEAIILDGIPRHPNVIQMFESVATRHHVFIFSQYGGPDNLDHLMCRRWGKRFESEDATGIFDDVLEAVLHLHSFAICHMDIKPENIMVGDDKILRLTDFGLSQRCRKPIKMFCGSLPFAAPEVLGAFHGTQQFHGDLADCFSMGVLLFTLFFGRDSMMEDLRWNHKSTSTLLQDPIALAADMRTVLLERQTVFQKKLGQISTMPVENEQALVHVLDDMLNPVASMRPSLKTIFPETHLNRTPSTNESCSAEHAQMADQ
jgi:serine/threonine protein kinase